MLTRRTNNVFPLVHFGGAVNRLFDDLFDASPNVPLFGPNETTFPTMNINEDADSIYVESELPGMKMDDIDIQLLGNTLSIKGHREVVRGDGITHHRRERFSGSFERQVSVPVEIDADKARAEMHDGVLTVTLPKVAAARPKKIKVNFQSN